MDCVNWVCPPVSAIKCAQGMQPERFVELLEEADRTLYLRSHSQFPGQNCLVELASCRSGCAPWFCGTCRVDSIDLQGKLGHPVHEVVAAQIGGVPQDVTGWKVREYRYLTRLDGWPAQAMVDPAASGWTVTVRYGRPPPLELLRERDRYLNKLVAEETGNFGCGGADKYGDLPTYERPAKPSRFIDLGEQPPIIEAVSYPTVFKVCDGAEMLAEWALHNQQPGNTLFTGNQL